MRTSALSMNGQASVCLFTSPGVVYTVRFSHDSGSFCEDQIGTNMWADLLWAMNTHSGCLGFQSHSYDGPECPVKLRGHPAEPQAFLRDSLHKGTLEGDVAIFLLQFPLLH